MHYTNKEKFGISHIKHKTEFELSDNLKTLYEVCKTCDYAITRNNYRVPRNLDKMICKSQTEYMTECCSCETVLECRNKHNCCCGAVLEKEIEDKRIKDKSLEAQGLLNRDPEMADLICIAKQEKENEKNE